MTPTTAVAMASLVCHKITYPIPGDKSGGCMHVYGKRDAENLLIVCNGYPDDHRAMTPLAKHFASLSSSSCLVGLVCHPGFDHDTSHKPYTMYDPAGYSFDDCAEGILQAVQALREYSTQPNASLTGILHDWGAATGSVYVNRALNSATKPSLIPDRLVMMDVLLPPHPKAEPPKPEDFVGVPTPSLVKRSFHGLVLTFYQLIFSSVFALRRYVSKSLASLTFQVGTQIMSTLRLGPLYNDPDNLDYRRTQYSDVGQLCYMCYPYFNVWSAIFTGQVKSILEFMTTPLDLEKTPILYMYGSRKRTHFHNYETMALLKREERQGRKSRIVTFEKGGHWFYQQDSERAYAEIENFIAMPASSTTSDTRTKDD